MIRIQADPFSLPGQGIDPDRAAIVARVNQYWNRIKAVLISLSIPSPSLEIQRGKYMQVQEKFTIGDKQYTVLEAHETAARVIIGEYNGIVASFEALEAQLNPENSTRLITIFAEEVDKSLQIVNDTYWSAVTPLKTKCKLYCKVFWGIAAVVTIISLVALKANEG